MKRPTWDEYFYQMLDVVKSRSTCLRRQVGAIAVSEDNRVLGTGYNGAIAGSMHCDKAGCLREKYNIPSGERHELCVAQHAEANVMNYASKYGVSLNGATMYITTQPCVGCMKAMITSGIKTVKYWGEYPDELSLRIAKESDIVLVNMSKNNKQLVPPKLHCGTCGYNDGIEYTSMPPKYKCTLTKEFHFANDECNVDLDDYFDMY